MSSNSNSSTHKTPRDLSPLSNKRKQPLHTEEEKPPTKKRQIINPSNNNNNNKNNNHNNKKNSKKNKINPTQNNPKNKNNNNQNKNNNLEKSKHSKGNGINNKKTPIIRKGVQNADENPNKIPLANPRLITTTTTTTTTILQKTQEQLNIEQIEQLVKKQPIHTTKTTTSTPTTILQQTTILQKVQKKKLNIEQIEQFLETQPTGTTILQKSQEELFREHFVATQPNPPSQFVTTTTPKKIPPFKFSPENFEFKQLANVTKNESGETSPIFIEFPFCPFVSIDTQRRAEPLLIERGNFASGWILKNKNKIQNILQRNEIALDLPQAISLRSWVLRHHAAKFHFVPEKHAVQISHSYEKQKRGIIVLTKQFNISPLTLFRSILHSRGWAKLFIKNELETLLRQILKIPPKSVPISKEETTENKNKKPLTLSDRDKEELLIAHQNDSTAPLIDDTFVHATNFEVNVAKFFQSRGLEFSTQSELIAHQKAQIGRAVSTPDLLVKPHQHVTMKLNGHEHRIHWIEIKMTFGSDLPLQQKSIYEQISGYKKYFGFGLLVFSFGCVDKIFDQYLKEGICLCVDSRIVGVKSDLESVEK